MATKVLNRTERLTSLQQLANGLQKHASTLPSLVIDGTSYKTSDIVTTLQGLVTSAQNVVSNRAAWQSAVQADQNARQGQQGFVSGLRQSLHVAFGGSIDTLADFGLAQHKTRTPRTPEQKLASTAKALATRAARHTMGSKQKAQIKGTADGASLAPAASSPAASPVVTPTAPASASPAIAPAPVTPSTVAPPAATAPAHS